MTIVRQTNDVLELYQSVKQEMIILWFTVLVGPPLGIWTLLATSSVPGLFVGLVFVLPLLFFLTTSMPYACTIDKQSSKIVFRKRGMLRSKVQEYWMHEVADIAVLPGDSGMYDLVFMLTSGRQERFGRSKDAEKAEETAIHVISFIESTP